MKEGEKKGGEGEKGGEERKEVGRKGGRERSYSINQNQDRNR